MHGVRPPLWKPERGGFGTCSHAWSSGEAIDAGSSFLYVPYLLIAILIAIATTPFLQYRLLKGSLMVKFMLLGHARSGSTLLVCGLMQHPGIHLFGEIFNNLEEERKSAFRAGLVNHDLVRPHKAAGALDVEGFYREGADAAEFLAKRVFYKHARDSVAVGFKLFYHQARATPGARRAWRYLAHQPDLRVVELVRRDLLASLLSLHLAFRTGEWMRPRGAAAPSEEPEPMQLTPAECEDYFAEVARRRRWARRHFAGHPVLEVEYERDVCGNFEETVYRIQEFVGVPRRRARRLLEKQARWSPRELIGNYAELHEHFRRTPYAYLFE